MRRVVATATARRAPSPPSPPATPVVVAPRLPFAEWVCLTLITQKVAHGWALGTMLAPDGELGRIWTLTPSAHLPGDRRARRQGPDHADRSGRRARS